MRSLSILISTVIVTFLSLGLSGQSELVLTEIMYNSPGEDLEFLEFYNNSADTLDLAGYEIVDGVNYSFPALRLAPEETFLVTNDSLDFDRMFQVQIAYEWSSGSLNNGGEMIAVINGQMDTIIQLEYDDVAPWPHLADGLGPSMVLCDLDGAMNDPDNWTTNYKLVAGTLIQGGKIFADPGEFSNCSFTLNSIWLTEPDFDSTRELERDFIIEIPVYYENKLGQGISVVARPGAISTATLDVDYRILVDTLNFEPGQTSPEFITIEILEDQDIEMNEGVRFELFELNFNNTPILFGQASDPQISFVILDDDGPITNNMELRGIIDAPQFKAVELYLKEDIELNALLDFGIGSANNGNGTDSIEQHIWGLVPEATCFFVTNDTIEIKRFLGPLDNRQLILVNDLDFNGNDAVELFEKGQLIDVYGFQNEDVEGTAWEYADGWAKRKSGGSSLIFSEDDWNYGGVGVLDVEVNEDSDNPYPLDCLPTAVGELGEEHAMTVYPNPATGMITIKSNKTMEKITIVDMMGRMVFQKSVDKSSQEEINVNGLEPGLYIIKCEGSGRNASVKLVVN